jgi:hypothetical protein
MNSLAINPHTNQAEAAITASFLRVRHSLDMGRKAGNSPSLAARCVR